MIKLTIIKIRHLCQKGGIKMKLKMLFTVLFAIGFVLLGLEGNVFVVTGIFFILSLFITKPLSRGVSKCLN